MKIMIPIKMFYSYIGYDTKGRQISYGSGQLEKKALHKMSDACLELAREANADVVNVQIIALTPLGFEIID